MAFQGATVWLTVHRILMNRRALIFIAVLSVIAPARSGQPAEGEPVPSKTVRFRRMIFDNDGNDPRDAKSQRPEDLLAARTAGLAGTHVDTLFHCTNSGFGESRRPSKVWPLVDTSATTGVVNRYFELEKSGTDMLRLMVEYGHQHGMEVFSNVRMNDIHDGAPSLEDAKRFAGNSFKAGHPGRLLNPKKVFRKPRTGSWSAANYALPEVRDSMFRYLEEACLGYDLDGLHLDFFRHPCYFRSTFLGSPCTDEERAVMSELMQRVRTMMREAGAKRGRPLLLSIRVPDSPAYCRDIGLDLERWLREGWVDLLAVSSYFQLSDWAGSVALGKKYGVPVYPSLDEARSKDAKVLARRVSLEAYRGRAAAAWGAGVSGIMLFNWTDPASPHWRELGDRTALLAKEKDYFASPRGAGLANGGHLPYSSYATGELLHPDNPRLIEPGKAATAKIRLGEMKTDGLKCHLRLCFARPVDPAGIHVEMDNIPLEGLKADGDWVEAVLPADAFKLTTPALHEVKVSLRGGGDSISWLDLMVTERHSSAASR
jgi:hypothetical protein